LVLTHNVIHKFLKLINYFRIHWKNTFSKGPTVTVYCILGKNIFDE